MESARLGFGMWILTWGLLGGACSGPGKGGQDSAPGVSAQGNGQGAAQGGAGGVNPFGAAPQTVNCGDRCAEDSVGVGTSTGFQVNADSSNGLLLSPEGALALVLKPPRERMQFLYVANAKEGTVSKINTQTGREEGRYLAALEKPGSRNRASAPIREKVQPSRTAVDFNGDVWVANRGYDPLDAVDTKAYQGTVTKIAHDNCPDLNGNGKVETSRDVSGDGKIDPADPLEFLGDSDECILFTVNVGRFGGLPRALALDGGGVDVRKSNAWVGNYNEMKFYKLDGDDGHVLTEVPVGIRPYGAAIDSNGMLWATENKAATGNAWFDFGILVSVNTLTGKAGNAVSLGWTCTGSYGIAIDQKSRVWVGGGWGFNGACRYDPSDGSIFPVILSDPGRGRGVAADASGNVWLALDPEGKPGSLVSFKADTGAERRVYRFAQDGVTTIGVGIDFDGKVWGVNQGSDTTCRVTPGSGEVRCFPTGKGPYTYSDFTGFALQNITAPMGRYRKIFQGCPGGETHWTQLGYDAQIPDGTQIEVYVKAGGDLATLQNARRVGPFSSSPVDLSSNPNIQGEILWVEVVLSTQKQGVTPVLKSLSVQRTCRAET